MLSNQKKRIALVWQGVSEVFDKWEDGLRLAMKTLESKYDISYIEPFDDLEGYDLLIYWESPCTINGENAKHYNTVRLHPTKKILLFSGGPVFRNWVEGFDEICIESQINKTEFLEQGIKTHTAFGINHELFKPKLVQKKYKAIHHGTCASWKRQWLLPQAFGSDSLLVGRFQKSDPHPFNYSKELGAQIIDEQKGDDLVKLICQSDVLVQSSEFWGGGQRATLEAMACGVPVICMEDSPKNIEYVEESGAGIVCKPSPEAIKEAYATIMQDYIAFSERAKKYVASKWTATHYAFSLDAVISKLI